MEQYADLAFTAEAMPVFGYGCAVFMQSDIVNFQRQGWRAEEILAGLAAVLPKNVFLYVAGIPNLAALGSRFILQGGTQNNLAVVKAEVDFIRSSFRAAGKEPEIIVHEHCGESGAIGAAVEALRLWRHGRRTTFIGLEAVRNISYRTTRNEDTRCYFCKNNCLRTFIDVDVSGRPAPAAAPAVTQLRAITSADQPSGASLRALSQPLIQVQLSVHSAETVPVPAPNFQDRKTKVPLLGGERRLIIATCEKGTVEDLEEMKEIKAELDSVKDLNPNFVDIAAHEAFKFRNVENITDPLPARAWLKGARERAIRMKRRASLKIGIPRVLNSYTYAPLFNGYLQSLGIPSENITYSDYTSPELYRAGASRGAIDPCFPAKIGIAHVYNLIFVKGLRKQFDVIFFPMVDVLHTPLVNLQGSNACPTVTACPNTVKAAFTKETDVFAEHGIQYLDPLLNFADRRLLAAQMYKCWAPALGLSMEENERAIEAGYKHQEQYEASIRRKARQVLDQLEREDRIGIVMLGRPYHHDPGLNHDIMEEFQKLGYPIFSQSTLPLDDDLLDNLFGDEVRTGVIKHPLDISDVWKNSYSASTNHKIWAAKFTARHPNLVAMEISNFKCGHDAPIYGVVEGIVERSGTPYFCFKDLDENKPAGSIKIRVETIDYFLQRYREVVIRRRKSEQEVEARLRAYEEVLAREVLDTPLSA